MANPTRQEIIEAYDALEKLCNRLPATRAAKEPILRALPPKPHPTMADVEWDDDKHFLAEAEHPDLGKVVMLRESVLIIFVQPIEKRMGDIHVARVEELTPTGKRYTLTEVQE